MENNNQGTKESDIKDASSKRFKPIKETLCRNRQFSD